MTNAEVQQVIAQAASRGIKINELAATNFLGAREILSRDPDNTNALTVVANFTQYMATGIKRVSFAEFMLPEFNTDEEIERQNKVAEEYRRATAAAPTP